MNIIKPGATIGILGGGQLGRMMAMAARSLGYRVQVMDPDPSCSARYVVDSCFEGSWSDTRVAANMARGCDVITFEIEQISQESLLAAGEFAPIRPTPQVLSMIQNRIDQKKWLVQHNLPVGPYHTVFSAEDLEAARTELGSDIFLKAAYGGYDGRSQIRVTSALPTMFVKAWQDLGAKPCVAEQAVQLEMEISVMVARSPCGEIRAFPSARNHHENQVLHWSVLPSTVTPEIEKKAQLLALKAAELLHVEGLLAVEFFLKKDGQLLINELSPRPHNSYHASEKACATSQFEQAIRAICNLPLGEVDIIQPTAIVNLLGDLWAEHDPYFDRALAVPGVHLHLYEKHQPRKGRKMGHLLATGETSNIALKRALTAMHKL